MSLLVRTYQTVGDVPEGERFLARVIVEERRKSGGSREGFSVCLYGETEQAVSDRAQAWITAERERQDRIAGNRAAAADKRRAQS